MKLEKIFCLIFLALLFTNCKKDSSQADEEVLQNQYEAMVILNQLGQLVEQHNNAGYPVGEALIRSMNDIRQEPSVKEAWHIDSMYICVAMNSGIQTRFSLMPLNAQGKAQFRGGGEGGGLFNQISSVLSGTCQEIENKTVLVYHPYKNLVSAVQLGSDEDLERYKSEGVIDDYNIVLHEACNYDVVKTFKDYGLVIISTHGYPDGFSFQEMDVQPELGDAFKSADEMVALLKQTQDKQVTDQIRLGLVYIELRKAYTPSAGMQQNWENGFNASWGLATSSPMIAQWDLSGTIVVGLHCYSGYESNLGLNPGVIPIAEAYRQAGARTYYGFQFLSGLSQPVDDYAAQDAERLIYKNFFADKDSTGNAHLNSNDQEMYDVRMHLNWMNKTKNYFRLVNGSDKYCFESCGQDLVDSRDGQVYKTVCIGDQVWMAENLRYLPQVHNSTAIEAAFNNSQPAYAVYGYNGSNISQAKSNPNYATYGVLYNWWAAMGGKATGSSANPSGVQGICPKGWHLPSMAEWEELFNHVGGANIAGGKLKEKGTAHWESPNTGATDAAGFTALPGGYYHFNGTFNLLNKTGFFWATNEIKSDGNMLGRVAYMSYNENKAALGSATKGVGYSCRCVKD